MVRLHCTWCGTAISSKKYGRCEIRKNIAGFIRYYTKPQKGGQGRIPTFGFYCSKWCRAEFNKHIKE